MVMVGSAIFRKPELLGMNDRAAFSLRPATWRWTTYLVHDQGLVYTQRMSFEHTWDRTVPYHDFISKEYGGEDDADI
jgi:hypothetical protein